jgi:hypothetical protein
MPLFSAKEPNAISFLNFFLGKVRRNFGDLKDKKEKTQQISKVG